MTADTCWYLSMIVQVLSHTIKDKHLCLYKYAIFTVSFPLTMDFLFYRCIQHVVVVQDKWFPHVGIIFRIYVERSSISSCHSMSFNKLILMVHNLNSYALKQWFWFLCKLYGICFHEKFKKSTSLRRRRLS